MSTDTTHMVAVGQSTRIYVSTDSGQTWTARETARDWRDVASSDDGTKMVAIAMGGQIYISSDAGVTWSAHENSRSWRGIGMSADGNRLVAAEYGGLIYTSSGNRTSVGNLGSVTAGQNDALQVRYLGNSQFAVPSSAGGPFTIR